MLFCLVFILLAVFTEGRIHQPVSPKDQQVSNGAAKARIVDGEDATKGQFPYQVGMYLDRQNFCGGSLISKTWVLTSSDCIVRVEQFMIFLGALNINHPVEQGRMAVNSRTSIMHENYGSRGPFDNNVGLVKLPYEIQPNDQINIISLPPRSFNNRNFTGESVRVSGWGKQSDWGTGISDRLQFVDLTVISKENCTIYYGDIITDKVVCAQGQSVESTCQGDGGGPLVITDEKTKTIVHFGVVSFVSSQGCGSGAPSGYDRTYKFLDWIRDKTGVPIQD